MSRSRTIPKNAHAPTLTLCKREHLQHPCPCQKKGRCTSCSNTNVSALDVPGPSPPPTPPPPPSPTPSLPPSDPAALPSPRCALSRPFSLACRVVPSCRPPSSDCAALGVSLCAFPVHLGDFLCSVLCNKAPKTRFSVYVEESTHICTFCIMHTS